MHDPTDPHCPECRAMIAAWLKETRSAVQFRTALPRNAGDHMPNEHTTAPPPPDLNAALRRARTDVPLRSAETEYQRVPTWLQPPPPPTETAHQRKMRAAEAAYQQSRLVPSPSR